ncbi:CoA-acylating methylmalonate-semialdehyde dehydrogenase [Conexibacter woesei]|uniref:methylmalonate-semialdehyde dehydrogenase (CoA acylating) n=1 Tax=Conexibacter woesei (strain DSM 14684 / CCUG 47730 / CIP 108061 / JCM 11494 / NBRC 100937 / ID131577) TaxID=469383 RepID=D3F5V1_CONWI|nr:CoA-acylating methylmalonate-semialdehyde dehydrogenase [Conexibacter woesei]ADB52650.1 methylmalonate-semialdehyde dehydrogenase [Conexibacter woesei DSM 14684]
MTATSTTTLNHWIGGREDAGTGDRFGEVTESATGELVARVAFATEADVDRAVRVAAEAADAWGRSSLGQRTKVMFAFREQVNSRRDELARAITREHGKVLSDAAGEVQRGMEVIDFACGLGHLLKGEMSGQVSRGVDSYSLRQPLGVVAGITPFNFPVMVPLWMAPVALAAGNAFVLKPSEQDPSASLLLADMLKNAGLPEGVFTVINGDKDAVNALLVHPEVRAVSFVGSTPIAKHVYETATAHGKRVQALGGAKNHAVVLPDADLDLAADALVSAGYGSAGQRCMAVSVAVAVGAIAEPLIAKIQERIAGLTVGDGFDAASEMGPLVSERHLGRVRGLVDSGEGDGATLLADGRAIAVEGREGGHWLGPTLFDNVRPGMAIYDEEIFGPVLCVVRADSYDEAVGLANSSPYGNGAAIFTNDGGAARQFEQDITAGMVGVNVPIPVPMAYHSFGGWKDSLFGDLHVHGPDGVRFYTRGKVITRRWPDPADRGIDLGFPVHS